MPAYAVEGSQERSDAAVTDAAPPDPYPRPGYYPRPGQLPPRAPLAVPPPAGPPLPPADPRLVVAVVRDIALGRRLAALTWVVALLHTGLGLVVLRQAALLVGVDSSLSTTSAVDELGAGALAARVALAAAVAILAGAGIRWAWRAAATLESLEAASRDGPNNPADGPLVASGPARLSILLRPVGPPAGAATPFDPRVESGRRLTQAALVATLIAAAVGLAALIGVAGATTTEAGRAWRWVAAASGAGWVVATLLAGAVVADITWRIAVAARGANIVAPLADSPGRLALRLLPALLLVAGAVPIALSPATDPANVSCRTSSLECAAVEVPVDHARGASSGTFRVVYGSTGQRRLASGRWSSRLAAPGRAAWSPRSRCSRASTRTSSTATTSSSLISGASASPTVTTARAPAGCSRARRRPPTPAVSLSRHA